MKWAVGILAKKLPFSLPLYIILIVTYSNKWAASLRSTKEERRAFLACIDPRELEDLYTEAQREKGLYIEIEVSRIFSEALAAARSDGNIEGCSFNASYNDELRMLILIPCGRIVDEMAFRQEIKNQLEVMASL